MCIFKTSLNLYYMNRDYRNPENGIVAFMDYPRYTTGYASLFNTLGITTEAHMFKDFRDRVLSTYHFMMAVAAFASENGKRIKTFFNWNFFDSILSRKEYFSPYVFEDIAKELLAKDPGLSEAFHLKKMEDTDFANDHYAQLRYLYERSPYSEVTYRRYPVARLFLEN